MYRRYIKYAISINILLILCECTGCSSIQEIEISKTCIERPKLQLKPNPIILEPVTYTLTNKGYAIDSTNFSKQMRNELKTLKLLREQAFIIDSYQKYYE